MLYPYMPKVDGDNYTEALSELVASASDEKKRTDRLRDLSPIVVKNDTDVFCSFSLSDDTFSELHCRVVKDNDYTPESEQLYISSDKTRFMVKESESRLVPTLFLIQIMFLLGLGRGIYQLGNIVRDIRNNEYFKPTSNAARKTALTDKGFSVFTKTVMIFFDNSRDTISSHNSLVTRGRESTKL